MRHFDNAELQHESSLGIAERLKRWVWGIVEFGTAPFALVLELFWHRNPGRRYFSLAGVLVTYYLILIIFYVGGFIGDLISNPGSFKPQMLIDPLGAQQRQGPPPPEAEKASPEYFFWSVKLFLAMAVVHKVVQLVRKIRKTEPELTVFGGESRIQFLLGYVPWLRVISINDEDACKRFIQPAVSYCIAKWIIVPFVDPLVGSFYCWCAIAMAIRAHCVRTRHQFEKDDLQDVWLKWQQLFRHLEESGPDSGKSVPRASTWVEPAGAMNNGSTK